MIDVCHRDSRFRTDLGWLDSRHSFSFGRHQDPANTNHGLLLVSNDDVVRAGTGFSTHPHQDMEIVTWVLDGELEHKDSTGHKGMLHRGLAQRMSAGTGIWHSEMNPSPGNGQGRDVHFVQMWVLPDTPGVDPSYEQLDVSGELDRGGLVAVASGRERGSHAAISIRQRDATLWAGRLRPDEVVKLPDAAHVHLFVAIGSVDLDGAGPLVAGDAARLAMAGERRTVAGPEGAEILVWETA